MDFSDEVSGEMSTFCLLFTEMLYIVFQMTNDIVIEWAIQNAR